MGPKPGVMMGKPSKKRRHQPAEEGVPPAAVNMASTSLPATLGQPAFAGIAAKLNKINGELATLQQLGLRHVEVQLPELVLVGDQSSGKSSLMSLLARLDLPRSAGTCTRCPFHICTSTSSDSRWSCTITLQQDYDYEPPNREIRPSDVKKSSPFFPWVPKAARHTKVFKTIYERDSAQIENALRWAQIAIMNPNNPYTMFVPDESPFTKELTLEEARKSAPAKFSPNLVGVEIKGPDQPNLSFYDLPGVFANAEEKGEDYLISVVSNLTRSYVQRDGAIIMLALPMDQDIENAKTLKVIRDAGAEQRTIGVITKADVPDLNNPDRQAYWRAVLNGEKQKVGHGFYCTSFPPTERLSSLRLWEESFFIDRDAWRFWPDAFGDFSGRCGTGRLHEYITQQLGDALMRSLPWMKATVEAKLATVQGELADLPDLPRNVEHAVKMAVKSFSDSIKNAVDSGVFSRRFKELSMQFHDCIVRMKPVCNVETEQKPKHTVIEIDDDDDEQDEVVPVQTPMKRKRQATETPKSARRRHEADVTPTRATGTRLMTGTPVKEEVPADPFAEFGKDYKLYITRIHKDIEAATRGIMHHTFPIEVQETLSLQAIRRWEGPLERYVTQSLEESLGRFRRRVIFPECQKHLNEFITKSEMQQSGRLRELFYNETYRMDTLNKKAFDQYRDIELELLERARIWHLAKAASLVDDSDRGSKVPFDEMTPEDRDRECKLRKSWEARLPPTDAYKPAIDVAADVRAYYLTAASRFVDVVISDVRYHFIRTFRDAEFEHYLNGHLGITNDGDNDSGAASGPVPSTYDWLMEEDPATAERRAKLRGDEAMLAKALDSIEAAEDSSRPSEERAARVGSSEARQRHEPATASSP
ncbi:P-loop containing nucleoside triphosphate hydrolase protein [Xylariaceae sp. FL0804]|nr:P-loop containing nucleoside triphosphate hydrolase protein [Xylariaceae sp. FL0804]